MLCIGECAAASTAPWWGTPLLTGGFVLVAALIALASNHRLKNSELERQDRRQWDAEILRVWIEIFKLVPTFTATRYKVPPVFEKVSEEKEGGTVKMAFVATPGRPKNQRLKGRLEHDEAKSGSFMSKWDHWGTFHERMEEAFVEMLDLQMSLDLIATDRVSTSAVALLEVCEGIMNATHDRVVPPKETFRNLTAAQRDLQFAVREELRINGTKSRPMWWRR